MSTLDLRNGSLRVKNGEQYIDVHAGLGFVEASVYPFKSEARKGWERQFIQVRHSEKFGIALLVFEFPPEGDINDLLPEQWKKSEVLWEYTQPFPGDD